MNEWVAVAIGGMLGALMRHGLSVTFSLLGPAWLPIATLLANCLGCFAMGILVVCTTYLGQHTHMLAIGLRVGLLGGLTTFSSFALDVAKSWHEGQEMTSATLVLAHVGLGLSALIIGMQAAKTLLPEVAGE